MKKSIKLLSVILALIIALSMFAACSQTSGGDEEAEPTSVPSNINDAPATTEYVAKCDGKEIYTNIFNYFLYDALNNVDFTGLILPEEATDDEIYNLRKDFLTTEKEPGLTHLQAAINETLEYCQRFIVSVTLAEEAGYNYTDEEIQSYYDSVDSTADSLLAYYGESEGCETRDEIVYAAVGMNVNDYKRFYISQLEVNAFSEAEKESYAPTEEALLAYYNENEDLYRTVTVRKILVAYAVVDSEGTALSDEQIAENKAAAREKIEKYVKIIEDNNLDMGSFSKGFSAETETSNLGLADVTKSSTLDSNLVEWALKQKGKTDKIEIIETTNGFYAIRCEGITTYSETSEVTLSSSVSNTSTQSSVLIALKAQMFEDKLVENSKAERFALTDVNNELITSVVDKFLKDDM